jgi:hypothetical protein
VTTIVYRDGIVAADTCASLGHINLPEIADKLFIVPKDKGGGVVAMIGASFAGMKLIKQILAGESPSVDLGNDAAVIHFGRPGTITVYEGDFHSPCNFTDFAAWGSGMEISLGALAMGADAIKAVEVAARFDSASSLPVNSINLEILWAS